MLAELINKFKARRKLKRTKKLENLRISPDTKRGEKSDSNELPHSMLEKTIRICKRVSRLFAPESDSGPALSPESKQMICHSLTLIPAKPGLKSCRKESNLSNLTHEILSAVNGVEKHFRWSDPLVTFTGLSSTEHYDLQNESKPSLDSVDSVTFELIQPEVLTEDFKTLWQRRETKGKWTWKPRFKISDALINVKYTPSSISQGTQNTNVKLRRKIQFDVADIAQLRPILKTLDPAGAQIVDTQCNQSPTVATHSADENDGVTVTQENHESDAETTLVESDSSVHEGELRGFEKTRSSLDASYRQKLNTAGSDDDFLGDIEDIRLQNESAIKKLVKRISKPRRFLRREDRALLNMKHECTTSVVLERNSTNGIAGIV